MPVLLISLLQKKVKATNFTFVSLTWLMPSVSPGFRSKENGLSRTLSKCRWTHGAHECSFSIKQVFCLKLCQNIPYGTSLGHSLEDSEEWTVSVLPDILQRDQKREIFSPTNWKSVKEKIIPLHYSSKCKKHHSVSSTASILERFKDS